MKIAQRVCIAIAAAAGLAFVAACSQRSAVLAADDGRDRSAEDLPELADDVFKPLDGGIALSADEIKGRNTWNLWCGGNEQFWDRMAREGYGLMDLLKTLDTRERATRFSDMGLINQPGYRQAAKPDRYGVWLDEAVEPEAASIDPKVYGRASGVMGFRVFDNPDFQGEAVMHWNAERYYGDADYALDPKLVRPYRVGVACGACHIAFNPCRPPADPVNPKWENLASAIGNQYIREGRTFAHLVKEGGLFWEMFKTQPAGTSDTSRIATDHINNPNAINPIFQLGARLDVASDEELAGEAVYLPGNVEHAQMKGDAFAPLHMQVPHILKDGADSVGVAGATLRVYVNIGMYSQHWLQQHNALIGLSAQKPFSIKTAQENSVYWRATQQKFANVIKFFTRLKSFRLEDAPGGPEHMTHDAAQLERGKLVFAENCAECHSSKRPPSDVVDQDDWFRKEVVKADFRDNNFFSDDKPYSITRLKTNAARACGTNAKRGHIWDNFSSETYKSRPAVGDIQVWNPYTEKNEPWSVPGGGSGYYRTPSLVCLWSSAPFLHNNSLGKFTGDPSVKGRMEAFDDAVEKLLWPEKRLGKDSIWRTSHECNLQIQSAVMPAELRTLLKSQIDDDGYFRLGPIPVGTPVNLLANLNPEMGFRQLVDLCLSVKLVLAEIHLKHLDSAQSKELMRDKLAAKLLAASTCPDLVEDRGHEFGADLPDADKRALIEFLKTL